MEDNKLKQQQLTQQRQAQQLPLNKLAASREGTSVCPVCGTANDIQATFCEHCGSPLHENQCPFCGTKVDPEADFCEHCQNYISSDRCSFCGAPMSYSDEFCQECGSPRKGIVCPTCHSLSLFGFCAHCGTPLTDRAVKEQQAAWHEDFAQQVRTLEREIEELWRTKPVGSKLERARRDRIEELRRRVFKLLSEDGDASYSDIPVEREQGNVPSIDELRNQTEQKRKILQELLDRMATTPTTNPAQARNTAMARKPHISRLAWRCNYRDALHPSPLACACPQKGGRWIVLSGKEEQQLTADR